MRVLIGLFLLLANIGLAQNNTEISILTCAPGDEVYSVFGHTAIRLVDKEKGIDQICNFGLFDFDTPNFALKFVNGRLKYHRGIESMDNFIRSYNYEKRVVREQKLNLSETQKIDFLNTLNILFLPENREYTYSFIEKNCSTETRDLLADIGVIYPQEQLDITHRELINSYLGNKPYLRFGTNLLLGLSLDSKSTLFESMFLPEYLEQGIDAASINGKKVVLETRELNQIYKENTFVLQKWLSPVVVFSLLFILLLYRFPKSIQIVCCALIGVIGLILITLWLFSAHPEVKNNLNVLWCNPLFLFYIPLILKDKTHNMLNYVLLSSLGVALLVWVFGIQGFDMAVLPIMGILGLLIFKQMMPDALRSLQLRRKYP